MNETRDTSPGTIPHNVGRPFGLRFAERCRPPEEVPPHFYDESRNLTMTMFPDGSSIPYVDLASAVGTKTMTKVTVESTDSDAQGITVAGTKTFTEVQSEQPDSDPTSQSPLFLGTRTETFVVSEKPDSDPSETRGSYPANDPDFVRRTHPRF